jgi:hypothetical protein
MNERLQQLAEQARQYAEEKQNDPFRIYTLDCFNKKFAELIVKECADICYDRDFTTGSAYGDEIHKHFGNDK